LGQAIWISVEMVRGGKEGGDPNKVDVEIDDEVIMHIFNTYAVYTPPHLRTPTLVVADQSKTTDTGDTSKVTTEVTAPLPVEGPQADSSPSSFFVEDENQNPAFSHICHRAGPMSSERSTFCSTGFCETAAKCIPLLQPPYPSPTKCSGVWS